MATCLRFPVWILIVQGTHTAKKTRIQGSGDDKCTEYLDIPSCAGGLDGLQRSDPTRAVADLWGGGGEVERYREKGQRNCSCFMGRKNKERPNTRLNKDQGSQFVKPTCRKVSQVRHAHPNHDLKKKKKVVAT